MNPLLTSMASPVLGVLMSKLIGGIMGDGGAAGAPGLQHTTPGPMYEAPDKPPVDAQFLQDPTPDVGPEAFDWQRYVDQRLFGGGAQQ